MTILIEIGRLNKDSWKIRIGDIEGSTTHSNISKKELIQVITTEIDEN
jgi:hypothetical protein